MIGVVAFGRPEQRRAAWDEVAEHLGAGGVVCYPTETVYGLGCALHPDGLRSLAAFKRDRPFLLLIASPDLPGLRWTPDARRLAEAFWPGPLTIALTADEARYPGEVVAPDGGVAVRVSPHPAIPDLLEAAGGPITSTSANRPGRPPARDGDAARDVAAALDETGVAVLVLDGGRLPEARPSTIVRCDATTRLIREGAIPRTELESVVDLE